MKEETLPKYLWYTEQMLAVPDADDATSSWTMATTTLLMHKGTQLEVATQKELWRRLL